MTTPDQFKQALHSFIQATGDTFSPFTGQPSKGIASPIITRVFGRDFDLSRDIIVRDDAGAEFYVLDIEWHANIAIVQLIPVLAVIPAQEA